MYVIEVFSIQANAWKPVHTTRNPAEADRVWHELHNNGLTPRIRRHTPSAGVK